MFVKQTRWRAVTPYKERALTLINEIQVLSQNFQSSRLVGMIIAHSQEIFFVLQRVNNLFQTEVWGSGNRIDFTYNKDCTNDEFTNLEITVHEIESQSIRTVCH